MKKRWIKRLGAALGMGLLLGLMFSMNVWSADSDPLVDDKWAAGVSQLTDYNTPKVTNLKQTGVKPGYMNISFGRPEGIPDGEVRYHVYKSLHSETEFPAEPDKIVTTAAETVRVSVKAANGQLYDIMVVPFAQGSSHGWSKTLSKCKALPAAAAIESQDSYPSKNKFSLVCKNQRSADGYRAVIYSLNGRKIRTYTAGISGAFSMSVSSKSFYRVVLNVYTKVDGKNHYGAARSIYIAQQTNYKRAYKTGKDTAKVSWDAIAGATGYRVYYSANLKKGYRRLATTKGTTYSGLKGLVPGKTYYVVIRAEKRVGKTIYAAPYTWNYGFIFK